MTFIPTVTVLLLIGLPAPLARAVPETEFVGEHAPDTIRADSSCEETRELKQARGGETADEMVQRLAKRLRAFLDAEREFQATTRECAGAEERAYVHKVVNQLALSYAHLGRSFRDTWALAQRPFSAAGANACEGGQHAAARGWRELRRQVEAAIGQARDLYDLRRLSHDHYLERLQALSAGAGGREGCPALLRNQYRRLLVLEWHPGCRAGWMQDDLTRLSEALAERVRQADTGSRRCQSLAQESPL